MQLNNNINSMVQLEKKLEQSANELSKLSLNNEELDHQEGKNLSKQSSKQEKEIVPQADISSEIVKQIEIPIAYTANAEVISTQNTLSQSSIDIKA